MPFPPQKSCRYPPSPGVCVCWAQHVTLAVPVHMATTPGVQQGSSTHPCAACARVYVFLRVCDCVCVFGLGTGVLACSIASSLEQALRRRPGSRTPPLQLMRLWSQRRAAGAASTLSLPPSSALCARYTPPPRAVAARSWEASVWCRRAHLGLCLAPHHPLPM